jgi:hypothetical protein
MRQFSICLLLIFTISIVACKKKKTTTSSSDTTTSNASSANVVLKINNKVGNENIEFGTIKYNNLALNNYSVNVLKYYISEIDLTKNNGELIKVTTTTFIDATDINHQTIKLGKIPNGEYTRIVMHLGVTQSLNHTGAQEGDLDPMFGMIWTWNTGYIFFKHEGQFIDSTGATKGISFHYGTDPAYAKIQIPANFVINGVDKNVYLNFDLNKLYAQPNKIDFNDGNNHQSSVKSDSIWIVQLKENFLNTFSFDHSN